MNFEQYFFKELANQYFNTRVSELASFAITEAETQIQSQKEAYGDFYVETFMGEAVKLVEGLNYDNSYVLRIDTTDLASILTYSVARDFADRLEELSRDMVEFILDIENR